MKTTSSLVNPLSAAMADAGLVSVADCYTLADWRAWACSPIGQSGIQTARAGLGHWKPEIAEGNGDSKGRFQFESGAWATVQTYRTATRTAGGFFGDNEELLFALEAPPVDLAGLMADGRIRQFTGKAKGGLSADITGGVTRRADGRTLADATARLLGIGSTELEVAGLTLDDIAMGIQGRVYRATYKGVERVITARNLALARDVSRRHFKVPTGGRGFKVKRVAGLELARRAVDTDDNGQRVEASLTFRREGRAVFTAHAGGALVSALAVPTAVPLSTWAEFVVRGGRAVALRAVRSLENKWGRALNQTTADDAIGTATQAMAAGLVRWHSRVSGILGFRMSVIEAGGHLSLQDCFNTPMHYPPTRKDNVRRRALLRLGSLAAKASITELGHGFTGKRLKGIRALLIGQTLDSVESGEVSNSRLADASSSAQRAEWAYASAGKTGGRAWVDTQSGLSNDGVEIPARAIDGAELAMGFESLPPVEASHGFNTPHGRGFYSSQCSVAAGLAFNRYGAGMATVVSGKRPIVRACLGCQFAAGLALGGLFQSGQSADGQRRTLAGLVAVLHGRTLADAVARSSARSQNVADACRGLGLNVDKGNGEFTTGGRTGKRAVASASKLAVERAVELVRARARAGRAVASAVEARFYRIVSKS